MPYSTWRDDSGDEWQQAPSLDLLPLEPGPISRRAWSPGLAKEDHPAQISEPGGTQTESFLWL